MIRIAILISAFISAFTGVTVIAMGEWRRFALKFAAVALCFSIDLAVLGILYIHPDEMVNQQHPGIFTTFGLLIIAKNIDHILFYIAFGRDAIQFKRRERRTTLYGENREAA